MEKERFRKIVCTTLMVGVACLSLVSIAFAQEDSVVKKGGIPPSRTAAPRVSSFVAPPNDNCAGALVINDGPYPVCSAVTNGIFDALDTGDPDPPTTCVGTGNFTTHSVWYTWTPTATGFYKILDCPGGVCGPATTQSTAGDGVIHVYTSVGGCAGPFVPFGCNDDGCGSAGQSSLISNFDAGTTYYVLVGYWDDGTNATPFDRAQLRIEVVPPPPNDTCATAQPLVLDQLTIGNVNPLATNNYQLPAGVLTAGCYQAGGQQGSGACSGGPTAGAPCTATANCGAGGTCVYSQLTGRDVAYQFTAPLEDDYSFRVTHYDGGTNNALMILGACDAGPVVATCLRAVNRNVPLTAGPFGAEEVSCLHLTTGQTVFPIVDNTATSSIALSRFEIQVIRCRAEREFNSTPAGAEDPEGDGGVPNSIALGCPVEGTAFQGIPGGDVDFFSLNSPVAGSRIFAQLDANGTPPNSLPSGNGVDFDMRVTTATDTLEYDDANNNTEFAGLSPQIAGRVLPGGSTYLRINMKSPTAFAQPYRLFTTVRAPGSGPLGTSAQAEPAPDDVNAFPVGDYFYGSVDNLPGFCNGPGHSGIPCTVSSDCPDSGTGEVCQDRRENDFYGFCARQGEEIFVSSDLDPTRDNTPFYSGLFLFLPDGNLVYGLGDTVAQGNTSSNAPGVGLTAITPFSPANGMNYKSTQTGMYTVLVNGQAEGAATGPYGAGDYLVQMSTGCVAQESDLEITKTGDVAAVAGGNVNYSITVSNNGPAMGSGASFHDTTPAGTTFVSITIPDHWDCVTPMVGETGDIDCFSIDDFGGPGCFDDSAKFDLTLNVPTCAGNGPITNSVEVFNSIADPDSSNNTGEVITVVVDPGTCDDGDPCTENDACDGTVCAGSQLDCDDSNPCTDDSCDAGDCVNTNNTAACDDGNGCTTGDTCADGACVSGANNTDPCDDGNACTLNDTCGGGTCNGGAGPDCNDGNVCTDDSCDVGIGCVNTCNNSCNTKGQGYWKRLCHGPHSGDFYTQRDVDCVNNTCTFADVQTVSQMCDELQPQPGQANDKCEKAEAKFMSLLLNVCRCRVSPGQSLDSRCGPGTTVAETMANSDATLCNPGRTPTECNHADCATFEIVNGEALWANSLRLSKSGTSIVLNWEPPYANPDTLSGNGPKKYHVYRRAAGSTGVFTQIGIINPNQALTFTDTTAGTASWTYEVTSEY